MEESEFKMTGDRVDDIEQAFEMGCSNNAHLIFANALIEQGSYEAAGELLVEAVSKDKEIAEDWAEKRALEEEEQEEMVIEILNSENATWISQVTKESFSGANRTKPHFLMCDKNDLSLSHKKKERLVNNLTKILGLKKLDSENPVFGIPGTYEPYDSKGEHFETRFPGVNFIIFYKNRSDNGNMLSDFEKLEEGWYYVFSSYHKN